MTNCDCRECFYADIQDSMVAPCRTCQNNDKLVPKDIFGLVSKDDFRVWDAHIREYPVDPLETNFPWFSEEDMIKDEYDSVEKPKHYMLFEEQGIEVRHVLEKLVEKIDRADCSKIGSGAMFFADYVQMMQYGLRFMDKNGKEDLEKMAWYLDKCIGAYPDGNDL